MTIEFAGQKKTAATVATGQWLVNLDPMSAGGELREQVVLSGIQKQPSKIPGVLVRDIWPCSGQPTMQVGVCDGKKAQQEQGIVFGIKSDFKDATTLRFNLPRDAKGNFDLTETRLTRTE